MLFKSVKYLLSNQEAETENELWFLLVFCLLFLVCCCHLSREDFAFVFIHSHTELRAASGCEAAPLEQAPAVEVPCLRALWSEDRTFLHVFVQGNFQPVNCDHFFCPPSCWDEPHRFFILLFVSWDIQALNIWVFFRIFPMDFMRQSTPRVCQRSFSHSCQ